MPLSHKINELPWSDPMLELIDLQTPLVRRVSLSVAGGESVTVSGPSGSGKSRLLRAIADLDPHEGELRVDGASATSMSPSQWRTRVQLLPADPQWWAPTVGDHFPDRGAPRMDGLSPAALDLPEDVFAWPVERLSSGERQRLALLRLLVRAPRVLLLDEPSANLDEENTRLLERLVDQYRREHDAAVIWVSHDKAQRARVGDTHYRIDEGSLSRLEAPAQSST